MNVELLALSLIKTLVTELAKHEWHEIDPDDETTWPNKNNFWLFRLEFYNGVNYRSGQTHGSLIDFLDGTRCAIHDATHYRHIVGPGGGESDPQKAHCESCQYEYLYNDRCSMCIGAHPGNDGYKSFYEKRDTEAKRMKKYGCPNVVDGKVCGCDRACVIEKIKLYGSFGPRPRKKSWSFCMNKHLLNPRQLDGPFICDNCHHEFTEPVEVAG